MATSQTSPSQLGFYMALVGTIVLGISAFLGWGGVLEVEIKGIDGDGQLTLGIAVVTLILLFIKKVPLWVPLILGGAALTIGIIALFGMQEAEKEVGANIGIGLYLTLLASLDIIVGTIVSMIQKNRT